MHVASYWFLFVYLITDLSISTCLSSVFVCAVCLSRMAMGYRLARSCCPPTRARASSRVFGFPLVHPQSATSRSRRVLAGHRLPSPSPTASHLAQWVLPPMQHMTPTTPRPPCACHRCLPSLACPAVGRRPRPLRPSARRPWAFQPPSARLFPWAFPPAQGCTSSVSYPRRRRRRPRRPTHSSARPGRPFPPTGSRRRRCRVAHPRCRALAPCRCRCRCPTGRPRRQSAAASTYRGRRSTTRQIGRPTLAAASRPNAAPRRARCRRTACRRRRGRGCQTRRQRRPRRLPRRRRPRP